MNFIPPHQLPVLSELAKRVGKLTVLISTRMEPNRSWRADWGDLDVQVQHSLTWRRPWRHPSGFTEDNFVHVPWDTLTRLRALSPDVILSGELGMRSVFSALYTSLAKKTRLVLMASMSEHTERGRGKARILLRKLLLRQCRCLVINGYSGARYVEELGLDPSRMIRALYAATADFFERGTAFRPPETCAPLAVFRPIRPAEGADSLSEGAPGLGGNESRAVGGIRSDRRRPALAQIAHFAMPANVQLRVQPAIPYHALPDAYLNGGILVFPTLADEWGMVVNEALAAGVPVLGSRYAQGVEDLCVEGVNGWLYRPDVGDEMRRALDAAMATSWEELNTMRARPANPCQGSLPSGSPTKCLTPSRGPSRTTDGREDPGVAVATRSWQQDENNG